MVKIGDDETRGIFGRILRLGEPNEISILVSLLESQECDKYVNKIMKILEPYKDSEIKIEGYRLLRGGLLVVYADEKEVAKLGYGEDDWHLGIETEVRLEERLKQEGYKISSSD